MSETSDSQHPPKKAAPRKKATAKPKPARKPAAAAKAAGTPEGAHGPEEKLQSGERSQSSSGEQPWWHAMADEEHPPNPVDVGTAAQEAVKLAGAIAQWADQTGLAETLKGIAEQAAESVMSAARTATGSGDSSDDGIAPDSEDSEAARNAASTCDNCPICQGVDIVKTMSPEAAEGITDALAAVTAAVRQAVDGFAPSAGGSKTRVEHIDID